MSNKSINATEVAEKDTLDYKTDRMVTKASHLGIKLNRHTVRVGILAEKRRLNSINPTHSTKKGYSVNG